MALIRRQAIITCRQTPDEHAQLAHARKRPQDSGGQGRTDSLRALRLVRVADPETDPDTQILVNAKESTIL